MNEGIVEGTRIRVTQVEEGIHCEFGGGTGFDENSMEKYLRLDDDMSLIYSHMSGDDYFNPVSYTHLTLPTNREV